MVEQVLALQELDIRIRELERELADIPARKKAEEERLRSHKEAVAGGENSLKQQQAGIRELELESASNKEKILKLRQQQMQVKTNKEFKAFEAEIATLESRIRGIEDKELVLMEQADAARGTVAEKKKSLETEQGALNVELMNWDARTAEVKGVLDGLRKERLSVVSHVAQDWLAVYERIFKRKDRAMVAVEDGICGGCHMKLPPYVIHTVRRKTGMVFCDFCGRMLY